MNTLNIYIYIYSTYKVDGVNSEGHIYNQNQEWEKDEKRTSLFKMKKDTVNLNCLSFRIVSVHCSFSGSFSFRCTQPNHLTS